MADWNVSVDVSFLQQPLTITSTSENPQKFELNQAVSISKQALVSGLANTQLAIPQEVQQYIPEDTTIEKFMIDGKNDLFNFAVKVELGAAHAINKYNSKIFTLNAVNYSITSQPEKDNVTVPTDPV